MPVACDHTDDDAVGRVFQRVDDERGRLDILVNNVWGGYERMMDNGAFTWPLPFWQQPLWRWDAMFAAGVRAHYHASQLAAPSMIAKGRGLIVHISSFAAEKYAGNVAYGVAKAATDKMAADMATELKRHGVTVVSLYPGLVRTEKVMEAAQWLDLSNSESPEFIGRSVVALARMLTSFATLEEFWSRRRSRGSTDSRTWTARRRVHWSGDGVQVRNAASARRCATTSASANPRAPAALQRRWLPPRRVDPERR